MRGMSSGPGGRPIDPTVDYVFQKLLGSEENTPLLLDFLRCVLPASWGIHDVTVMNPYNPKAFMDDKYGIVDVKAKDFQGRVFQIEMQAWAKDGLPQRMLYSHAKICSSQLVEGANYAALPSVVGIWLLMHNLVPVKRTRKVELQYTWREAETGLCLDEGQMILVFQLQNLGRDGKMETDRASWLRFFAEGKNINLDHPPEWVRRRPVLEKAVSVLRHISNDQREYLLYDSREKARRDSPEYLLDSAVFHAGEALAAKKQTAEAKAQAAEAKAQAAKEKARAEAAEAQIARALEEKAEAEAQIAALVAKLARLEQQAAPDGPTDR